MKYLTPRIVEEVTGGEYVGAGDSLDICIKGFVRDNREVAKGNMFVCIQGARADGHAFANSAYDSGAVCCLAEKRISDAKGPYVLVPSTTESIKKIGGYYRRLFGIPFIGVTGSVGKTTTKEMIAAALGSRFRVLKTVDNMNNELGVPLTLLSVDETHEAAVIEMGISDFGEMSRLADMVKPDICVITKIGYSHIETLGSLDGVLRAKSEVFAYMDADGIAVVNGDDEILRGYDPGIRKVSFGIEEHNDYRAAGVKAAGIDKVTFDIVTGEGRFKAEVPSYGSHLAMAALAAAAVGRLLEMTNADIARGLLSYSPVGGRANVRETGGFTLIDDCYNANPNSVAAALSSLSSLPGRRIAILGDMLELGDRSDKLHHEVGAFAARSGIDLLICCGSMAEFIYKGYEEAGGSKARYYPDKAELAALLPDIIKRGDAVLVKASRGMRFEELVGVLANCSINNKPDNASR